mgnify:FL=1
MTKLYETCREIYWLKGEIIILLIKVIITITILIIKYINLSSS